MTREDDEDGGDDRDDLRPLPERQEDGEPRVVDRRVQSRPPQLEFLSDTSPVGQETGDRRMRIGVGMVNHPKDTRKKGFRRGHR